MEPPSPNLGGGMTEPSQCWQRGSPPPTCACTAVSYGDNDDDDDNEGGLTVEGHGGRRRGGSGPHPGKERVGCGGARLTTSATTMAKEAILP